MKPSIIKPGLLVSLSVRSRGGVIYQRREIEADHTTAEGSRLARWETEREILDPAEFERAGVARSKARALVTGVCCSSAFGLLCPQEKEAELSLAIEEARRVAADYNAAASESRVEVFVMVGRVAQDDVEAAKAIGAEVRELMEEMSKGIAEADPEAIREAANKARSLGGMLTAENSQKVADAIAEARRAARVIVKRIEKAGEPAALVVKALATQSINAARFAFLDMDERDAEALKVEGRGVDLDATLPGAVALAASAPLFELEGVS